MNILETILNNGTIVNQVASQMNLDASDAQKAMQHMLPALTKGLTNNMKQEGGLEGLIGALQTGNHKKYVENPDILTKQETIQDGNAILGHILGSKDVSRNVAGHAAQETGLDFGLLKQMLPVLATLVMGSLSKQTSQTGALQQGGAGGALGGLASMLGLGGQQRSSGNATLDMLGSFLDADKDGSAVDDILNMAKKFF